VRTPLAPFATAECFEFSPAMAVVLFQAARMACSLVRLKAKVARVNSFAT